jgi:hypothetical protein
MVAVWLAQLAAAIQKQSEWLACVATAQLEVITPYCCLYTPMQSTKPLL